MACPSAQNFPNVCCFPPLKSCVVRRLHRYVKSIKRGDGGAYFNVEDTDGDTYQRSGLFTYKVRAGVVGTTVITKGVPPPLTTTTSGRRARLCRVRDNLPPFATASDPPLPSGLLSKSGSRRARRSRRAGSSLTSTARAAP